MPLETSNDARPTPGAIRQAAIAGALGLLLAAAGWYVAIPVLSGIAIAVGFFLVAMAIYTQLVLRRRRAKARRIEP
jgi:Flp pilus assembly protein TadB